MPDTVDTSKAPSPIDVAVGARVRIRRKQMALSQETLAAFLGLTFQQVQKYERGSNRISASKLYEVARCLQVPINYFFEDFADPQSATDATPVLNLTQALYDRSIFDTVTSMISMSHDERTFIRNNATTLLRLRAGGNVEPLPIPTPANQPVRQSSLKSAGRAKIEELRDKPLGTEVKIALGMFANVKAMSNAIYNVGGPSWTTFKRISTGYVITKVAQPTK